MSPTNSTCKIIGSSHFTYLMLLQPICDPFCKPYLPAISINGHWKVPMMHLHKNEKKIVHIIVINKKPCSY
jgi:hypothetical protein